VIENDMMEPEKKVSLQKFLKGFGDSGDKKDKLDEEDGE